LQNQAVTILTTGLGLLQSTLANLVLAILIAVVTLFMMLDGAKIWWWLLNHVPIRNKERFNIVLRRNLLGFFWGRLLLSIFFGISTFVVFLILGVPFPLVMALIAGVFDLIPGIGATIGIGLVALLLLPQSIWLSIQAIVVCIGLQQVEENLLLPYVMKDSLDINPVVMFFALIVGATVAGVLGLFLAVPVAGVIITWLDIEAMRGKSAQD
ncbi:MAG: AI-2E family transporter, partial [Nodosilinea sp.]